jgi:hypothetical protein
MGRLENNGKTDPVRTGTSLLNNLLSFGLSLKKSSKSGVVSHVYIDSRMRTKKKRGKRKNSVQPEHRAPTSALCQFRMYRFISILTVAIDTIYIVNVIRVLICRPQPCGKA